MELLKKLAHMGVGALLILLVIFGVAGTFAQEEQGTAASAPEVVEPGVEARAAGLAAHPGPGPGERGQYLAEALGISIEALAEAREAVRLAGIDAALEQGLITNAQAELLREREERLPGRLLFPIETFEFDAETALADALGISVEELEAAHEEAQALALAARVETGQITEEEAAMIAARQSVREYFDREGLAEVMEQMYEEAVQQALAAGDITEEQAELLLENPPAFDRIGQGRPGRGGPRGHHGRPGPGGFDGPGSFAPQPFQGVPTGPGA